jgi:hypothetical protein
MRPTAGKVLQSPAAELALRPAPSEGSLDHSLDNNFELSGLSQIEGSPQRGLKVTVYGLNPWNAMLTFGVDSGPVPNKADLQALFDVIAERLKRLYDV